MPVLGDIEALLETGATLERRRLEAGSVLIPETSAMPEKKCFPCFLLSFVSFRI